MDEGGIEIMNGRSNRLRDENMDFAAALLELVSLKSATKHSTVNQFCQLLIEESGSGPLLPNILALLKPYIAI